MIAHQWALIALLCILPHIAGYASEDDPANTPEQTDTQSAAKASSSAKPLPRARHIDLTQPVKEEEPAPAVTDTPNSKQPAISTDAPIYNGDLGRALIMLGAQIPSATASRLSWSPEETFEGIAAPTPVLVVNGALPGPTLCLTGAVHGDEINGIEIIRQVMYELKPEKMSGTVIGVPIVNQLGFRRNSRYLPDRRDLNRYFPGNPQGSSASRIAHSFFQEIVRHCDALVDLHTGSFHRTNLPQLRADLRHPGVAQLSHSFGGMVVLQSEGRRGTLRREAVRAGIPTVTLEAGEPMRIQQDVVDDGVKRIRTLLTNMGIYKRPLFWPSREPVYYQSLWVRADQGGFLISQVDLGNQVSKGDLLGKVVNPITNIETAIHAPFNGRVIGMALNQVVMPGFATYHLGRERSPEDIAEKDDTVQEESQEIGENGTREHSENEPEDDLLLANDTEVDNNPQAPVSQDTE